MTDHELCLQAAKAAGYTVEDRGDWILRTLDSGLSRMWDPLSRSAQAFDLMVDCGIDVEMAPEIPAVFTVLFGREGIIDSWCEPFCTDKHAATRRVIVRAAAAMGASDAEL